MFKRFSAIVLCFAFLPLVNGEEAEVKTVYVQLVADNENVGYEAYLAMDGNVNTIWHTQFYADPYINLHPHHVRCAYYACSYDHPEVHGGAPLPMGMLPLDWIDLMNSERTDDVAKAAFFGITRKTGSHRPPPHALGIDLGNAYPLTGFTYTPRANDMRGNFEQYELYVSKDEENGKVLFGRPISSGTFSGNEKVYTIDFGTTVETRYLKFVGLTTKGNSPLGVIAECQPIAEGYRFIASNTERLQPGAKIVARIPNNPNDPALQERIDEWNLLAQRFETPLYWEAIKDEVASPASLILSEDRDPLDVIVRRVSAIFGIGEGLKGLKEWAANISVDDVVKRFEVFQFVCGFRRETLLKSDFSPLTNAPKEILFVKRHRSCCPHMCDQFYGTNQRPGC